MPVIAGRYWKRAASTRKSRRLLLSLRPRSGCASKMHDRANPHQVCPRSIETHSPYPGYRDRPRGQVPAMSEEPKKTYPVTVDFGVWFEIRSLVASEQI